MAEDQKTAEDQGLVKLAGPTGNKIQPVDARDEGALLTVSAPAQRDGSYSGWGMRLALER